MTVSAASVDWIAVDWGTTACRAWAVSAEGAVLGSARSRLGMSTLEKAGFEGALKDLAGQWLGRDVPVIACGMVGSRQGWVEAPYAKVPCAPEQLSTVRAPTTDPALTVVVVGGIRQDQPADVMRGEETQISGYLAQNPGFDGVICLPGTHTKWAQISAGEIVSFRTAMTGEMFDLLANRSVLRHGVGDGWSDDAFADAIGDALSRPEALAAKLFSVRAEGLLKGLDPGAARARLSGLLIGAELASMRPYWLGQPIVIIGDAGLAGIYETALRLQGSAPVLAAVEETTLAGLARVYETLGENA